jgi:two-component system C4-dicarboxylate transport response regulator DctD
MTPGVDVSEADVLVIDDEEVVRTGIARVLSGEGLRVALSADAAGALAHPALASCRAVICDLMLPDRSGLELLRDIRRRRPDVPLVCITGYATRDQMELAEQAGATVFLPKPFDEEELLSVVRRALDPGAPALQRRR